MDEEKKRGSQTLVLKEGKQKAEKRRKEGKEKK